MIITDLVYLIREGKITDLSDLKSKWLVLNTQFNDDLLSSVWDLALSCSWDGSNLLEHVLWLEKFQPIIQNSTVIVQNDQENSEDQTAKEPKIVTWVNSVTITDGHFSLVTMEKALELRKDIPHLSVFYLDGTKVTGGKVSKSNLIPIHWCEDSNQWLAEGSIIRKVLPKTQVFIG